MRVAKIKKGKTYEPAVLWTCRTCGVFNLHPVEWGEFDCIFCGTIYQTCFDLKEKS